MRTINIRTEIDVIAARMYVRELARSVGMNLGDQARISLATSSLAHTLGVGVTHPGQITLEHLRRDERQGVRVVCTEKNDQPRDLASVALGDTRWMVDECTIEKLPSDGWQVTLIKWLT